MYMKNQFRNFSAEMNLTRTIVFIYLILLETIIADECVPKNMLKNAMKNGVRIYNMQQALGRTIKSSNILVNVSDPGGLFFFLPDIDRNLRQHYNDADMLISVTQVLRNEVCFSSANKTIMSSETFKNYLGHNQETCTELKLLKSICRKKHNSGCSTNERYRSFDGTCNNLNNQNQGATYATYLRILPPAYYDDIMEVRRSHKTESELPSARLLSTSLFPIVDLQCSSGIKPKKDKSSVVPNINSLFFFQTIIHDAAFLAGKKHGLEPHDGLQCCTADRKHFLPHNLQHYACDAIRIPVDDPYYNKDGITCMNFIRGQFGTKSECSLSAAHPMNLVSSYLDGSFIYGIFTKKKNDWMRTYEMGQLTMCTKNILPRTDDTYISGDFRSGQSPQLSVIHSLFYREHNRIAKILHSVNEQWNDEKLFQEARRIVVALLQQYAYQELLPVYMGRDYLEETGIIGDEMNITCYSSDLDSTAIVEFNSGVSRVLHAFIPNKWQEIDEFDRVTSERMSDYFGFVDFLQTRYENILRGILTQPLNFDGYPIELLNYLFRAENKYGIDLLAYDITRGRDNGLQPYYKYRSICGLPEIQSWNDLKSTHSEKSIYKMKLLYESVFDIDLYVGAALEVYEEMLSPTMKCFFKVQYKNLKCGDRFFYTNKNSPYPFTDDQLVAITKDSFARLLCDNSELTHVQRNAFQTAGPGNEKESCDNLPEFNLKLWKEINN